MKLSFRRLLPGAFILSALLAACGGSGAPDQEIKTTIRTIVPGARGCVPEARESDPALAAHFDSLAREANVIAGPEEVSFDPADNSQSTEVDVELFDADNALLLAGRLSCRLGGCGNGSSSNNCVRGGCVPNGAKTDCTPCTCSDPATCNACTCTRSIAVPTAAAAELQE